MLAIANLGGIDVNPGSLCVSPTISMCLFRGCYRARLITWFWRHAAAADNQFSPQFCVGCTVHCFESSPPFLRVRP
jgi:hypothetical protein